MIINSFEFILNSDPQIKNETTSPSTPLTNYSKLYVLKENIGGNDANTELLIQSSGTNGSTTFTDSSSNGFTINNIGSTTHMLGRSKINKTGINFIKDLSQALSVAGHTNLTFGTGDFTIDFYIDASKAGVGNPIDLGAGSGTRIVMYSQGIGFNCLDGSGTTHRLGDLSKSHVAIVRDTGVINFYVNGVNVSSSADTTNYPQADIYIGKNNPTDNDGGIGYFLGSIDEFRVSKGIARWTTDFEPPTQPYDKDVLRLCLKDENGNIIKFN